MTTTYQTAEDAIAYLTTVLPAAPSAGLQQMVTDLMATGLPISFESVAGSPMGTALVRADGIVIGLADVPLNEGVVGHELAHALLETKGWPCLFAAESPDHWVGRIQKTLSSLLDHSAGIALQRTYGIDCEPYEQLLLDKQQAAMELLQGKSSVLNTMEMTAEQELEYGVGLALAAVERFWRTNIVPADFIRAMELFPGSHALFIAITDMVPAGTPTQGWAARQLMGMIVERLDDYMEIKGDVRPVMVLSHFVPGIHPDDAPEALGNVARLVMVPLSTDVPGEHSILILPNRDGLPFGFRQVLADNDIMQDFAERVVHAPFGAFCRALVPEAFCFWQPEGPSQLPQPALA